MTLVIKIGSCVLVDEQQIINQMVISHLAAQIASLREFHQIVIVSSGAIAAGKSILKKSDAVLANRQILASIGQIELLNLYAREFSRHNLDVAQGLVTRQDFDRRAKYLNMRNFFENLLKENSVIPIINENDVLSPRQPTFSDNDELAGLIALMINADQLILLTNVDGLYTGDPADPESTLLKMIPCGKSVPKHYLDSAKSSLGLGGIQNKVHIAQNTTQVGIGVHIANGRTPRILEKILNLESPGTYFLPCHTKKSSKKRWLASPTHQEKGLVVLNPGLIKRLQNSFEALSILPVGIDQVEGNFLPGEVVALVDRQRRFIGRGISEYNRDQLAEVIGQKSQKPAVKYENLFIY